MTTIDRRTLPTPTTTRSLLRAGIAWATLVTAVCSGCSEEPSQGLPERQPEAPTAATVETQTESHAKAPARRTPAPGDFREAVRKHLESDPEWQYDLEEPTEASVGPLQLDRIHEEVRATEGGRRVVCVDFKAADGALYDVDFYVTSETDGNFVEDVILHSVGSEDVLPERRAELDRER